MSFYIEKIGFSAYISEETIGLIGVFIILIIITFAIKRFIND